MKEKVKLTIAVILLSVITFACQNNKKTFEEECLLEDFPEIIELKSDGYVLDDRQALLRYPFRVRMCDEYLFVFDMHNAENFCHIYNKETFDYITSFGKRGEGPHEMLRGQTMLVVSLDTIWTLDPGKRQITRWSFSPADGTVTLVENIQLDKRDVISAHDMALRNDSTWFIPDLSGQSRVWHIGRSGNVIERTGNIPTQRSVNKDALAPLASAWNPYIHYHYGNKIHVVATQLGDVLEIYNLQTGKRKVIYGPQGEPVYQTTPQGYAVPTGIMGYSDVQITDNYIYTVFHGTTFEEVAADPIGTEDGGRFLRVFDLEGNLVRCYHLDHAIYGIHVNEKEGIIWATDVNTEEQIVKYHLPELNLNK